MTKKTNTKRFKNRFLTKPHTILIVVFVLGLAAFPLWPNIIKEDVNNECFGGSSTLVAAKVETTVVPNFMASKYVHEAREQNRCIWSAETLGFGEWFNIRK